MQHTTTPTAQVSEKNPHITYSLQVESSPEFYHQLADFTDKMIKESEFFLSKDVEAFSNFYSEEYPEKLRHLQEHIIEYIALGTYIVKYGSYAVNTGTWATSGIEYLYSLRKKSSTLKPVVDNVRGVLSAHLLYKKSEERVPYTRETVYKLLNWMKASGEFSEESERISQWAFYLSTIDEAAVVSFIARCISFSKYFEEQAKFYLGEYTKGVNEFLNNEHLQYKYREDYLFTGRSEVEYHLNMFGAEVLNRILKTEFDKTQKKILMLPTCMRQGANCKATDKGNYLICNSCSETCKVNQIKQSVRIKKCETVLVPHSSDFSDFLKSWQNQTHTGLIGVGCVLNLLTGGYELQRLNIPSQCVYLDYSGCKKHWHSKGIPTKLDQIQLNKILSAVKTAQVTTNA